ncbi:hypothetical protein, partial [Salmonella enterica]|uniref:hypothetical protein n=1 Tax=Salmonella enterica TaxID=28901 RepID=UPI003297B14E
NDHRSSETADHGRTPPPSTASPNPRSALKNPLQRIRKPRNRATDIMQLVEAEQPETERLEIVPFVTHLRHARRDLQP